MSKQKRSTRLSLWLEKRYTGRIALLVIAGLIVARICIDQVVEFPRLLVETTFNGAFTLAVLFYLFAGSDRRSRAKAGGQPQRPDQT